jgi:triacylglycerol lipase
MIWLVPCAKHPAALAGDAADAAAPAASAEDAWVEFSRSQLLSDVVYRQVGERALRMDIYRPRGVELAVRLPVVILIHGGAWTTGDKRTIATYARDLAEAGIAAAAIEYRLAPKHPYPAAVHDAAAAVAFVGQQGARFGIDPQRIGVWGYSAGAHLACMLATCGDESQDLCSDVLGCQSPPAVCCAVAGGAPCDLRTIPPSATVVAHFLGGTRSELPEVYIEASPAAHASAGDKPIFFYHGTRDLMVPVEMARGLYELHRALGIPSEFLAVEGQGHILTFLLPDGRQAAVQFLRSHLQAAN